MPTKKGKTRVSRETQQTGETRKPRKAGEDRGSRDTWETRELWAMRPEILVIVKTRKSRESESQ